MQVGALESYAEPSAVDRVLTGLEFDELPPVEKTEAVSIMSVFARVEPSHKSKLVELLKAQVSWHLCIECSFRAVHHTSSKVLQCSIGHHKLYVRLRLHNALSSIAPVLQSHCTKTDSCAYC